MKFIGYISIIALFIYIIYKKAIHKIDNWLKNTFTIIPSDDEKWFEYDEI